MHSRLPVRRRRLQLGALTCALAALAAPAATSAAGPTSTGPVGHASSPAPYRAGQAIVLRSADGRRVARCTSSFPIKARRGWLGLTAGGCAQGMTAPVRVGRRRGDRGALGRARRSALRAPWLSFRLRRGLSVRLQIDRGRRAPLRVRGWVRTAALEAGTRVCFAGGTSGADRCGSIRPDIGPTTPRGLVCAGVRARPGDSGAPVYLDPGRGRRTRAVGILQVLLQRPGARPGICFTPIEDVLTRLGRERLRSAGARADRGG